MKLWNRHSWETGAATEELLTHQYVSKECQDIRRYILGKKILNLFAVMSAERFPETDMRRIALDFEEVGLELL